MLLIYYWNKKDEDPNVIRYSVQPVGNAFMFPDWFVIAEYPSNETIMVKP